MVVYIKLVCVRALFAVNYLNFAKSPQVDRVHRPGNLVPRGGHRKSEA